MYTYIEPIPMSETIREGIRLYVTQRLEPGGFLYSVLCNDLKGACMRADDYNRWSLFSIVDHLYNECPVTCWGSPEKVSAWLAG